jgi:hypothetical protein
MQMAPIIKNAKTLTLGWVIVIMLLFLVPTIYYIEDGAIPAGRSGEAILREESPLSFWFHIIGANTIWLFMLYLYIKARKKS